MADTYLKYVEAFKKVLPNGKAWLKKFEEGSGFLKLIRACTKEFGRIEDRVWQLYEECDPRTATETLEDWERVLDLPDRCIEDPDSLTVAQRRNFITQKITGRGGYRNLQYYVDQAATLGYDITAQNYTAFRAGHGAAGDPLIDDNWAYWWNVNAASTAIYFRAGSGAAGDPLVEYGEETLECLLTRLQPAHTDIFFTYDV